MKIKIPYHIRFSTFVWLLSVFITATFFTLASLSKAGIFGGPWGMFQLMVGIGFVCSIPCWILLCIASWKINQGEMTEQKKKIIINVIAVILTFALFTILFYSTRLLRFGITAPIAYSLTITLGIWIFPLQRKNYVKWEEHILDDNIF